MTLKQMLGQFTHFTVKPDGMFFAYTVDKCDVCEGAIQGANPMQFRGQGITVQVLQKHKLTRQDRVPDEGGWSDEHDGVCCNSCA